MKAYRGKPGIFESRSAEEKAAELEVKNLSLSFGGVKALNDVDISVRTGELVAIIEPNGAGKTSLLNCMTGFYRPQNGRIVFNGKDITHLPPHHVVRIGIGRTFQNIELFPGMTVLSNILLARHNYCKYGIAGACLFSSSVRKEEVRQRRVIEELVDFLEIQAIRKKKVGSLPYGLMKRVELGRALALEPALLILDEPFAGMNLEEKEDMASLEIPVVPDVCIMIATLSRLPFCNSLRNKSGFSRSSFSPISNRSEKLTSHELSLYVRIPVGSM